MYVLGLNIGHNATACLLKDGKITSCVSEERFSRIKNHSGIPFESIKFLLKEQNISMQNLDLVVLDDHYGIDKDPYFGKRFLEAYTKKSSFRKMLSYLGYRYPNLFDIYKNYKENAQKAARPEFLRKLKLELARELKISQSKIIAIDHHFAHACSTCFNLEKNSETLIFTLDGEGSGVSASVSIFDGEKIR